MPQYEVSHLVLRTWVVLVLPVLLRSLAVYWPISKTLILPRPLVTWPTSEILAPLLCYQSKVEVGSKLF